MPGDVVRFIRKNGKVIPIRAASGHVRRVVKVARTAQAVHGAYHFQKNRTLKPQGVKVNRALDIGGLGLSVASGALAAATFSAGAKGFLGGSLASHLLDVAGVSANVASVAGKGKIKKRAEQASKQEARNFAVGNAVYLAGILGFKRNRQAAIGYATKVMDFARKVLRVSVA